MNTNLDKIAQDLYKVLDSRFSDLKFADENAEVLSKKTDIPLARFFEFEYKDQGVPLGTITITIDEDDGMMVELLGDLAKKSHPGVFKLIKGLRLFSKNNMLPFHVEKIGKQNLDKRDYHFRAKPKEFEPMTAMMESRLYGTAKVSYEDLGESRLVIKHSQPVNTALPAGRTMHIESIYIENSQGERFKYPFKHMAGARALAEHLNNGGIPYDGIGKHITGLSEELAQLRMFKGHVTRNSALAEAMDDITPKVIDRIDAIKEEINRLARPAYYKEFAEEFAESESREIPEDILNDWVDRLTIRTFNENLKTAFPYIFKLIDESDLPVKELNPEDMLGEDEDEDQFERGYNESAVAEGSAHGYNVAKWYQKYGDQIKLMKWLRKEAGLPKDADVYFDDADLVWGDKTIIPDALVNPKLKFNDLLNAVIKASGSTHQPYEFKHNAYRRIPAVGAPGDHHQAGRGENESYLENFLNSIMKEDASQEGTNTLFSSNIDVRTHALEQLKDILKPGLPTGTDGLTASQSLKGIIDSETFHNDYLEKLGSDGDTLTALKLYIADLADGKIQEPSLPPEAEEVAKEIIAGGELDSIKPDEQGDETPVGGEPAPEAPPAEPAPAPAPEAPPAEPAPAATAPMAPPEGVAPPMAEDFSQGSETNYSPFTRTQNEEMGGNPRKEILKSIAGFWNKEEKNFTIGGTRVKTIILKNFKNGEYPHASVEDVKEIFAKIDKLDPSSPHEHELGRIKHLAGLGGHSEEPAEDVLYKQPAAHPGPTNIKP